MKRIVILANGEFKPDARLRELWRAADLRIAANGGALHAREHFELAPQVLIGDLDSLNEASIEWLENERAELVKHPLAKDQTDLELALDFAERRGAEEIIVMGAFGKREDQFLANLFLATRFPKIKYLDGHSELWLSRGEANILGTVGDTVSLIPLSETVEAIQTRGLKYPLNREALIRGTTRGVSNEMIEPRATIVFESGQLLIVHLFN